MLKTRKSSHVFRQSYALNWIRIENFAIEEYSNGFPQEVLDPEDGSSYTTMINIVNLSKPVGERLILPLQTEFLEVCLGTLAAPQDHGSVKSKSALNGYMSAIKFTIREAGLPISEDQARLFKSFQDGYKRVVAQKKSDGVMKNSEGKVAITFKIYLQLARLALFVSQIRSAFSSFVHLYMLLCWNLFARSCSVS